MSEIDWSLWFLDLIQDRITLDDYKYIILQMMIAEFEGD